MVSFPQVPPLKPCMQLCCLPYMPHAPISLDSNTCIIFVQYRSYSSSLWSHFHSHVTFSVRGLKILSTLEHSWPTFLPHSERPSLTLIQSDSKIIAKLRHYNYQNIKKKLFYTHKCTLICTRMKIWYFLHWFSRNSTLNIMRHFLALNFTLHKISWNS